MTRAEERKDRDLRVLELRRAGVTFDRIASQVGFASRATALKAYRRALEATGGPLIDRDAARVEQVDRMDRLLSVFWPKAMKGDLEASREVRQIERLRAYLLGTATPTATRFDAPDGGDELPLASGGATVVDNDTLERLRKLKYDGNPGGAS